MNLMFAYEVSACLHYDRRPNVESFRTVPAEVGLRRDMCVSWRRCSANLNISRYTTV